MNLRARLSERVHIENIREILHYIQDDERLREEIYRLIYDEDSIVSYQALWVCTHFSKPEVEWLSGKQNELIDATLTCPHSGKRRMLLNLLCQQPLADPPRVDLLDFSGFCHSQLAVISGNLIFQKVSVCTQQSVCGEAETSEGKISVLLCVYKETGETTGRINKSS